LTRDMHPVDGPAPADMPVSLSGELSGCIYHVEKQEINLANKPNLNLDSMYYKKVLYTTFATQFIRLIIHCFG
jgi:hypothetical protein